MNFGPGEGREENDGQILALVRAPASQHAPGCVVRVCPSISQTKSQFCTRVLPKADASGAEIHQGEKGARYAHSTREATSARVHDEKRA